MSESANERSAGPVGSVPLAWIMEQAKRYDIPLKDCRTVDDCQYREMAWAFRFVAEKWREEQEEPNKRLVPSESRSCQIEHDEGPTCRLPPKCEPVDADAKEKHP